MNISFIFKNEDINFVTKEIDQLLQSQLEKLIEYIIEYIRCDKEKSVHDLIMDLVSIHRFSFIELYSDIKTLNITKREIDYSRRSYRNYKKNGNPKSILFEDSECLKNIISFIDISIYKRDKLIKTFNKDIFIEWDGDYVPIDITLSELIFNRNKIPLKSKNMYYVEKYNIYFKVNKDVQIDDDKNSDCTFLDLM